MLLHRRLRPFLLAAGDDSQEMVQTPYLCQRETMDGGEP
jgi:hypothetical protein